MSDAVYNIPVGLPVEGHWKSVLLRAPRVGLLVEAYKGLKGGPSEVTGCILTLPAVEEHSRFDIDSDAAMVEALPDGLLFDIYAEDEDLPKLYLWRITLSRLRTFIILRFGPELYKQVKQVTGMGYAVKLPDDCFAKKNHKLMLKIMNYYFHDKKLQVPIEPVHTLFKTWVSGKGINLQEFYHRDTKKYIVIGDDGNPEKPPSSCDILSPPPEIKPYGRVRDDLFKGMNECSVCSAFRICGGACNLLHHSGDCSGIRDVADVLGREAEEMLRAVNEINERKQLKEEEYGREER
ncbi:MAG: hypothetical protein AB9866_19995 [Syntrophobacteraceae bacterium]